MSFLVPKLVLPSFWIMWGHFRQFFKLFTFFEIFSSFLVWKMGEKKFLEKYHFLVPNFGVTQFLNDLGHFSKFLKFGSFLAIFEIFHYFQKFFRVFWSEK